MRRGRFVGDDHRRFGDQRKSDENSLLHSATELMWILLKCGLRQANFSKGSCDMFVRPVLQPLGVPRYHFIENRTDTAHWI